MKISIEDIIKVFECLKDYESQVEEAKATIIVNFVNKETDGIKIEETHLLRMMVDVFGKYHDQNKQLRTHKKILWGIALSVMSDTDINQAVYPKKEKT